MAAVLESNECAIATYNEFQRLHVEFWESSLMEHMKNIDFKKAFSIMYVLICQDEHTINEVYSFIESKAESA